jgi:hypothetical protein
MPHVMTWPVVVGLSVVGAAAGIGLGRSAIAELNPAYFQDRGGSSFFADLAPNRPVQRADWAQVTAAEYQQQANAPAPAPAAGGCVGCATWPMDPRPVHDPAIERSLKQAWREARAPAPQPEVRYVETLVYEAAPAPDPGRERIRRYSSYPVTRGQAAPPPPEEEFDPADQGDAATQ